MDIIRIPIGYLLEGCYAITHNYAIALLLFTIVMNVVLFPLGIKQQKNMVKQASLRPKEMAIRQKVSEEVMKMYQDEKFSMFSGCLPMVFQMIILFALYAVIQNPLHYVNHINTENVDKIGVKMAEMYKDGELVTEGTSDSIISRLDSMKKTLEDGKELKNGLSGIEIANLLRINGVEDFSEYLPEGFTKENLPNFSIFGGALDLSLTPSIKQIDWLIIVPILVFLSYFLSMKLTRKLSYQAPTAGNQGASMKFMDVGMPLISVVFSFQVPALLGVYWIYNSVFSVLKQYLLKVIYPYPEYTEEEYKAAEKQYASGTKVDRASVKRAQASGKIASHRIDLMPEEITETDKEEESGASDDEVEVEAPVKLKQDKSAEKRKKGNK